MEETFEQKLARILATPLPQTDINTPYVFRYYLDSRNKENPAIYVTFEGPSGGILDAIQGRKTLGWRDEKIIWEIFTKLRFECEIHDGHLLTEPEARLITHDMGLSSIDDIKRKITKLFFDTNQYTPNMVEEKPEVIIERRRVGKIEAKNRGWD
jgi:hypothetical protein